MRQSESRVLSGLRLTEHSVTELVRSSQHLLESVREGAVGASLSQRYHTAGTSNGGL